MRSGLTRRLPLAHRKGEAAVVPRQFAGPRPLARPRTGRAAAELSALLMVAQRDVVKLIRDRPRLGVNLAFPVLLIAGLGGLLQATVGKVTGLNTVALAFTGVLAASLFQSAAAGMISIVEDRENDFSRELFIAPVSRLTLLAGKVTGESAVAVGQGVCIAAFAIAIGVRMDGWQVGGIAGAGLACCLLGPASASSRSRSCRPSAPRCRSSSS